MSGSQDVSNVQDGNGRVKEILVSDVAGGKMMSLGSVQAIQDKGLEGDRYFSAQGTFSEALAGVPDFQITLIEQEEIDTFNDVSGHQYTAADFRRNIATTDVRLNDLEGKIFKVGDVVLEGVRLCEPCAHLSKLLGPSVMTHMLHKCGLRARIVTGGTIKVQNIVSAQ